MTDIVRIAYVTTTTSMPGVDPGILVQEYENDEGTLINANTVADKSFTPGWGEDADGDFNRSQIEESLLMLGYRRVGEWEHGAGQLTALVEEGA